MEEHTGRPDRSGEVAGAHRQRCAKIDGCLKGQNPAYRLTCTKNKGWNGDAVPALLFQLQSILIPVVPNVLHIVVVFQHVDELLHIFDVFFRL